MLGAGGPVLLSVDEIIVAVTHRGRPQCERVGARRRFGDAERLQTKRARRDLRPIMLLLLLATVAQHGIHDVHLRVASRSVAAARLDLLHNDCRRGEITTRTAISLRPELDRKTVVSGTLL